MSRIEAGKAEIALSRFSVRDLAEDLVEMLRPLASEKGIALYNHVAADLPQIESDSFKCKHILGNLLSNAVKFTNQGKVEVSAAIREDEINITVADSGIGIAANQLEYIFDEFRQGDESTTRQNGGTGLGLAIAKKYAQMLGGGINELLSAVRNMIGKSIRSSVSRESPPEKAEPQHALRRLSILVVEDNADNLTTIKALLQENYGVIDAVDGPQGLEQARRYQPALILLDLALPGMDGFQVLRELKKDTTLRHIPVIALTARAFSEDREEILAYGFDGYLSKPVDSKLLEETIRRFADAEQET